MSGFTKGGRDYLQPGTYNIMCAYCGRKRKANELVRDDQFARGLLVCVEHRDLRQPQEFARGIKEDMTAPFVQPPVVNFVFVCTLTGISAIPDWAIPDCSIPDRPLAPGVQLPDDLYNYELTAEPNDLLNESQQDIIRDASGLFPIKVQP